MGRSAAGLGTVLHNPQLCRRATSQIALMLLPAPLMWTAITAVVRGVILRPCLLGIQSGRFIDFAKHRNRAPLNHGGDRADPKIAGQENFLARPMPKAERATFRAAVPC